MAHLTTCCVHVLITLSHIVKSSSSEIHVQSQQWRCWRVGDKDIRAIKQISNLFYVYTVGIEQVLTF